MMVAMRDIAQCAARNHFDIRADYIKSADNVGADAASREEWDRLAQFAERVLGSRCMRQVDPILDIEGMLQRMQRARVAQERRQTHSISTTPRCQRRR